ncbi:enoyl-CoA hydratase-related protein [Alsobacter sp. SYSU M60028]|uniref:Enoyl-CoA hydratase-related protein n=1 Tax=Alsobacter ponti TaxID=2962936 RepID=A0ABT1L9J5_9HYPH|nr:enoyl-CoA hydratase-related protein [Alsobacter ponti]MCP8937766.1 enoyl-CoA hydratase-related protein [Alsobacter ponti]
MADLVKIDREGSIAVITIDRPATLNALDMKTLDALATAVSDCDRDPEVKVVVFTGAGDRAFVAGGDIADLNSRQGLPHYLELAEKLHTVFRAIELLDKPTIAAINGWALGGGTELLLAIDLRIAAQSARFGLPEITLGLFPGAGGTQRLIRQVPLCKAKELMFMGSRLTAADAERIGLINKVVADADLMTEVMSMARAIAEKSPLVLKLLKRTLNDGADMPLGAALRHEQAMIGLVLDSADAHEGCTAFLEKRPAQFRGT